MLIVITGRLPNKLPSNNSGKTKHWPGAQPTRRANASPSVPRQSVQSAPNPPNDPPPPDHRASLSQATNQHGENAKPRKQPRAPAKPILPPRHPTPRRQTHNCLRKPVPDTCRPPNVAKRQPQRRPHHAAVKPTTSRPSRPETKAPEETVLRAGGLAPDAKPPVATIPPRMELRLDLSRPAAFDQTFRPRVIRLQLTAPLLPNMSRVT